MESPSGNWLAKSARADVGPFWLGILLLLGLAAYFPSLGGGFIWDDDAHVTPLGLQPLHGLWRIWFEVGASQQYYPVLHSAFWIEHRLWGDAVLGYHLTNLGLHTLAGWLLARFLCRLSFSAPRLAGLLFALHPVCVESVAWIAEQKNTLSAVFYFLSALVYLRFDVSRRRALYAGALALFLLALLTKTVTASLPAALLLLFWWRRGLRFKRDVVPLLPWFVLGAAAGLFTSWAERNLIGAQGADFSWSFLQRLLLCGRVVVFYFWKLLWPVDLIFIYPRWTIDPGQVMQWLPLLGVLAVLATLGIYAKRRRGPAVGAFFFVGTLFPVLGFVNVYPFRFSLVADHFQYLACLGVLVPAAWAVSWAGRRLPWGTAGQAGLLLIVPLTLGILTWRQSSLYRNCFALYRATLQRNPSAWLIHYNLAVALGDGPEALPEAVSEYRATLLLNPKHWAAHNNLASALLKLPGEAPEAIAEYRAALQLNPDFAAAQNNLGVALGHVSGKSEEAAAHLRAAIRLGPDYDAAYNNLGVLLMRSGGSAAEALEQFDTAIRLAPGNAEYHYNRANVLMDDRRLPEAVAEYRTALRLHPDYAAAHSNLGAALAKIPGHLDEAVSEYEAALRLLPKSAPVHANLANALSRMPGGSGRAAAEYALAESLDPANAEAHNDFGVLLSDMPGRLGDAVAEFRQAVRLAPHSAKAHFCLGFCLARAGDRAGAVRELTQALEIKPDFEPARAALDRVQSAPP